MPDRLVRPKPSRNQQLGRGRKAHRAVEDQEAISGDDPVGRPHRAAAVGRFPGRSQARPQERNAARSAARPYRHGGERPGARPMLDAADRLAGRVGQRTEIMAVRERSFDWRLPAVWAVLLTISVFAHAYVEVADSGHRLGFGRAVVQEAASHIMVAALLPAIYWLHRRFPIGASPRNILIRNILIHVLAIVPFSVTRTVGMTGLRLLWFVGLMGERYSFPLTADRLFYEFSKDIVNYAMLSAAVVAIRYVLERRPSSEPALPPARTPSPPPTALPERFAVRKRGGNEVVVEVADIDWIEAAGNYAVLHVGGDTFEIRSSLSKLEAELDPKRFVRGHKSHMVNIARVTEVTPWISGDWRIRLQDGAEVNLSRRYRQRFEALAPVRS